MAEFFLRLFVKDYQTMDRDPVVRQKCGMVGGAIGIFLNVCLFGFKLLAGLVSNSIAIMADAVNNLSDAGSSVVTLFGFKMAGKPADEEHPFGHGRIEYVAGLIVSMAIMLMGIELCKSSVEKIITPETVVFSTLSIVILAVSILVKGWMCLFNRSLGKRMKSTTIQATAMDSLSDAISTTAVLIGVLVSRMTGWHVDGYIGVLVAVFILYTGFTTARETLDLLLGHPPERELVQAIEEMVLSHSEVIGVHDLVVHNYGPGRSMISLHAEVPCDADIMHMHDTIDLIEMELKERFQCDAVIHMDPIVTNDEQTNRLHIQMVEILQAIDPRLSLHDFRMTAGPTHTNLIFDVVVPYRFAYTDKQLTQLIEQKAKELDERYFTVIQIDHLYV